MKINKKVVVVIIIAFFSLAFVCAGDFKMVSAGQNHSVGLTENGYVWTWGYNSSGQLGDGTTVNKNTPIRVLGISDVASVSAGYSHTIAVKKDGTVWAWGANGSGQLGDGTTVTKNTPTRILGLTDVASVSAGYLHTIAVKNDGTVWVWGSNYYGELGDGTTVNKNTPIRVLGITDVASVSAGNSHTIAVKKDSTVWAWGSNGSGQLGDGTKVDKNTPTRILGLTDVASVSAGNSLTLAVKKDDTVWAWGNNTSGELGDGTTVNKNTPIRVLGITDVASVSAGNSHTIVVKKDGTVWAWGNNSSGQLGDGTTVNKNTPIRVLGITDIASVSAGYLHTIAVKDDGTVRAWGSTDFGQLGDGTTVNKNTPTRILGITDVASVSAGYSHTIAVKKDSTVWAWGNNTSGELGDGTTVNKNTPIRVLGITDVASVSAGNSHTIAVKDDGTVWAWGSNSTGQLGDGTNVNKNTPIQVLGITDAVSLSAGNSHTIAVKDDGTVWAWGSNSTGQLGDGTKVNKDSPIRVHEITDVASVSAGYSHTIAVKKDGTVWAWGYNGGGVLGDGTTVNKNSPIQVLGITDVATVSTINSHTIAVKKDGTVWAWGNNTSGQLGYGDLWKASPVLVLADYRPPVITNFSFGSNFIKINPVFTNINIKDALSSGTEPVSGIDPTSITIKKGETVLVQAPSYNATTGLVGPITISGLSNGLHTLTLSVSDYAGNVATATTTVKIDKQAPVITGFTYPTNYIKSNPTFASVLINDPKPTGVTEVSGVKPSTISVSTGTLSPASPTYNSSTGAVGSFSVTGLPEGINTFTLSVSDNAGNSTSATATVKIDRTSPLVSNLQLSKPITNVEPVISSVTVKDSTGGGTSDISGIKTQFVVKKGSVTLVTTSATHGYNATSGVVSPITITGLADGDHNLTFIAYDKAENPTEYPFTVTIDKTKPAFTAKINGEITKPSATHRIPVLLENIVETSNITWYYVLNTEDRILFTPDTIQNTTNLSAILNIALTGTNNKLKIIAKDTAGNETTSAELNLLVDSTAPVITATGLATTLASSVWVKKNTYTVTAVDNSLKTFTSTIQKQNTDGTWQSASPVTIAANTITLTESGIYKISLSASDNSGNSTSKEVYAKCDIDVPTIIFNQIVGNIVSVEGKDAHSGVDETSYKWQINYGVFNTGKVATIPEGIGHTLTYYVTDKVGNDSIEYTREYSADTTPPVITGTAERFAKGNILTLTSLVSSDASSVTNVQYSIDGADYVDLLNFASNRTITIGDLLEGRHELILSAIDEYNNRGISSPIEFVVDKTKPVVTSLTVKNGTTVISPQAYTSAESLGIEAVTADAGLVVKWRWAVTKELGSVPQFTEDRSSTLAEFTVTNLAPGLNYLYVQAIDAAGNVSDSFVCKIFIDRTTPAKPYVLSSTHPSALTVEKASPANKAVFVIKSLSGTVSGIEGYEWVLKKTRIINGVEGLSEIVDLPQDSFIAAKEAATLLLELPDNSENEFYQLFVSVVGGNGLVSEQTKYQFRIDSTPPKDLRIWKAPQSDTVLWYSEQNAAISWNKPADMTGVKTYYYTLKDGVDASTDVSSWIKTGLNEVSVNLRSVLNGKTSGLVTIHVCAEDFAENRKFETSTILCDFARPSISSVDISKPADAEESSRTISWSAFTDSESGPSHLVLTVSGTGFERVLTLAPHETGITVEGLELNQQFTVSLRGFDAAGNMVEMRKAFTTGTAQLPQTYAVPYSENINGYILTGKRIVSVDGDTFEDVVLKLPETILLSSVSEVDGAIVKTRVQEFALENLVLSNGEIQTANGGSGNYEIVIDGFMLQSTGLSFNRQTGVALTGSVYSRPVETDGTLTQKAVSLSSVSIGFPPVPRLSSGKATLDEPVSIRTTVTGPENDREVGFTVDDLESLSLSGGLENLFGTPATVSTESFASKGILITTSGGVRALPLRNISVEAESSDLKATVDAENFILNMSGATYQVNHAGIRGNLLDVYDSYLALPEGYSPRQIKIGNFTINGLTGTVTQGADFFADTFTGTSPDGHEYTVTKIGLDLFGRLLADAVFTAGVYGGLSGTGIPIGDLGADWAQGALVTSFSTTVHGFPVSASSARLTVDGILIEAGSIGIYQEARPIAGLGLKTDAFNSVYRNGSITAAFSADTGYDRNVEFENGTIEQTGVYSAVRIPIPQAFTSNGMADTWQMNRVALFSDGTCSGTDSETRPLVISGFTTTISGIEFVGPEIRSQTVSVTAPTGFTPQTVELERLSFNWNGVRETPSNEGVYVHSFDGFNMHYRSLVLDDRGLGGVGYLLLSEILGGDVLEFPDSRITASGEVNSGKVSPEYNLAFVHDLPVFLIEATLTKLDGTYAISCDTPSLSLAWIEGGSIGLGKTLLASDGGVISGEPGTGASSFVSANGMRVNAQSPRIAQNAVVMGGSVSAVWWQAGVSISMPADSVTLNSDYTVTARNNAASLQYQFADWTIRGTGFSVDSASVTFASNTVTFKGKSVELGTFAFSPKGVLRERAVNAQAMNLGLFTSFDTLTETRFDEEGLYASLVVALPSQLGGYGLEFDIVRLYPDNTVFVHSMIDRFQCNVDSFDFEFEAIRLGENGLTIGKARLTLDERFDGTQISLEGLRISTDGSLSIQNTNIPPFALWGMNFRLDGFSIQNGTIGMSGLVCLPESMPGALSGRKLVIENFKVALDGTSLEFSARLDGNYTVPFLEDWALSFNTLKIALVNGNPVIKIDRANLVFPAGYLVTEAEVRGIAFNPRTGAFDYSGIEITTNIQMTLSGIVFSLNNLSIDSALTVGFEGSAKFPSTGVPTFIAGRTANELKLQIHKDGSLGDVSIKLSGLKGEIFPEFSALILEDGSLKLEKLGERSLLLSFGGSLLLNASVPDGLRGKALRIETFTVDASAGKITELRAGLAVQDGTEWSNDPAKINFDPVIFSTQFNNVYAGIVWDAAEQTGSLSLSGGLIFPASFPAVFAGKEAAVTEFEIGLDASVTAFGAAFSTPENERYDAFGALQLSGVSIEARLNSDVMSYDLEGTMFLPEGKFPEGIAGSQMFLKMAFNSTGALLTATGEYSFNRILLFNTLPIQNGSVLIQKEHNNPLVIGVTGTFELPDFFPEGLRGKTIDITELKFETSGKILVIKASVQDFSTSIFNSVGISNAYIDISNGELNEFIFSIKGDVSLKNIPLPTQLKDKTFKIEKLILSTKNGLRDFTIDTTNLDQFEFIKDVKLTASKISITDTGFGFTANATLGPSFPNGLSNANFVLTRLEVDWSGKIKEISGGLGFMHLELGGYDATIEGLYFDKGNDNNYWVTLKSAKIKLPINVGTISSEAIIIKNARFNPITGDFEGSIGVDRIRTDVCAGFILDLNEPVINFKTGVIAFSSVEVSLPSNIKTVGGLAIRLYNVKITPNNGLMLNGVGFTLPTIEIGELKLHKIYLNFVLDGDHYLLEGGGGIEIPDIGIVSVEVSFTEISKDFPIGLKYANFEYSTVALGIPLGSSGLFLQGIKGGVSYEIPKDLPQIAYELGSVSKGIWLSMAVTIGEPTGIIKMIPATWINIQKGDWIFKGGIKLLGGLVKVPEPFAASFNQNGFAMDLSFYIEFAKGVVHVRVFEKGNRIQLSGTGNIGVTIPKGFILDAPIVWYTPEFIFKGFDSYTKWHKHTLENAIPSSDLHLTPSGDIEFGTFNDKYIGVKAFVDTHLPGFGKIGVFVAAPNILTTNINSYSLSQSTYNMNYSKNTIVNNNRVSQGSLLTKSYDYLNKPERYTLRIPPKKSNISDISLSAKDLSLSMSANNNQISSSNQINESGLERIIFVISYAQGEPEIIAISPSGKEYRPGDVDVETGYYNNSVMYSVSSPESGEWNILVANIEKDSYSVKVFGKNQIPEISLITPKYFSESVKNTFLVNGITDQISGLVNVYLTTRKEIAGIEIGQLEVQPDGSFVGELSTSLVPDGEYLVYASFANTGLNYTPISFAEGTLLVQRTNESFISPINLRLVESEPGSITLSWDNPNGARTSHFIVKEKIHRVTNQWIQEYNVGLLNSITINEYQFGDVIEFSVFAVGENNLTSECSKSVVIQIGEQKNTNNTPRIKNNNIHIELSAGMNLSGNIDFFVDNFSNSESNPDYALIVPANTDIQNDGIRIDFGRPIQMNSIYCLASFFINVTPDVIPGIYEKSFVIKNDRNPDLRDEFKLLIHVSYPSPIIDEIIPSTVDGRENSIIEIFGSGFVPGSRIFYNEIELPLTIDYLESGKIINTTLPPVKNAGTYSLTILSPSGEKVTSSIKVDYPDWKPFVLSNIFEVLSGKTAIYDIAATSLFDYVGDAPLALVSTEAGFGVEIPSLRAGDSGRILINVPLGTPVGRYETVISGGDNKNLTLYTIVTEDVVLPVINSILPSAGYVGDLVGIYGFNFGSEGVVKLDGNSLDTLLWNDNEVLFIIPEEARSGLLTITTDNGISEAISFTVLKNGFSIRPEETRIIMSPGETYSIDLLITGHSSPVSLTCITPNDFKGFTSFSSNIVTPNATTSLVVTADSFVSNGNYQFIVSGLSQNIAMTTTIQVVIGDAFAISTLKLPSGVLDIDYSTALSHQNSEGVVTYTIEEGFLPRGLFLSSNGVISGKPIAEGSYNFTLTATDGLGRKDSRKYYLRIIPELWYMKGKEGGNTNSVSYDIPSLKILKWQTEQQDNPKDMLVIPDFVFVHGNKTVSAYKTSNGVPAWRLDEEYTKILYSGNYLLALSLDGLLRAYDPFNGRLAWSREEIINITVNDDLIVAIKSDSICVIDAYTGGLVLQQPYTYNLLGDYVWIADELCEITEHSIKSVFGSDFNYYTEDSILNVSADSDGVVIITDRLIATMDLTGKFQHKLDITHSDEPLLAIDSDSILVYQYNILTMYSRKTLVHEWDIVDSIKQITLARGKIVTIGFNGLRVLNRVSGKTIWSNIQGVVNCALYGGSIFTTDLDGSIRVYHGTSNASPPETTLSITPSDNNGNNGWYIQKPIVKINAQDVESYVQNTYITFNNSDWITASESYLLDDGIFAIRAYSIDSEGYRGKEVFTNIKVDTISPISNIALSKTQAFDDWYLEPLTISLSANDNVSGVDRLLINNMTYSSPILLSEEGSNKITWFAIDIAGNSETSRTLEVLLDLYPPYAESSVALDDGIAVVTLKASDTGSGVAYIEYMGENGSLRRYAEPLVFLEQGLHRISYRAVDKAGRASEWKICEVRVGRNHGWSRIIGLAEAGGESRETRGPSYPGMPLYERTGRRHEWFDNRAWNLPQYAVGGDYIVWKEKDNVKTDDPLGSFRVKKEAVAYVFIASPSVDPAGWSLVERNVRINGRLYPNGADVYMRRFAAGSLASIPGKQGGNAAPLVVVQEQLPVTVDIGVYTYTQHPSIPCWLTVNTGRKNEKKTLEPVPGAQVQVYSQVKPYHHASALALTEKWYVDTGSGWIPFNGGAYTLPWTDSSLTVRFKVEIVLADGFVVGTAEEEVRVKNNASFTLTNPRANEVLQAGSSVSLSYRATDAFGLPVHESQVKIRQSLNGGPETDVTAKNRIQIPNAEGTYKLIFTWKTANGHEQQQTYSWSVRKRR